MPGQRRWNCWCLVYLASGTKKPNNARDHDASNRPNAGLPARTALHLSALAEGGEFRGLGRRLSLVLPLHFLHLPRPWVEAAGAGARPGIGAPLDGFGAGT